MLMVSANGSGLMLAICVKGPPYLMAQQTDSISFLTRMGLIPSMQLLFANWVLLIAVAMECQK